MANDHHDERGRFCSAGQERAAQARMQGKIGQLTMSGRIDEALGLTDKYKELWPNATPSTDLNEIETAGFDTISVGAFFDKAKNIFARNRTIPDAVGSQKHEPDAFDKLAPLPEGRFAIESENGTQHEFQDYNTDFKNIRGFFRVTGNPEEDAAAYERAGKIDKAWGIRQEFQDAEAAVLFEGVGTFATAAEQQYFYNPELKASIPDLTGWQPENETQGFIVKHMIDAALNQKTAAMENAGLQEDPALEALGLDQDPDRDFKIVKGQDTNEDSGLISNYDEGWLTGFYTAVTNASVQHFEPGDTASQKAQLGTFIAAQRAVWQQRADLIDNDFNAGAVDGFAEDNWESELR